MNNIYVFGDVCPRWGDGGLFDTEDSRQVFHDIIDLYDKDDVVICNLEAPATLSDKKLPKSSMNLKAKPDDVKVLKLAGIKGCALANNHILDYEAQGLEDTFKNLKDNDICGYGAGDIDKAVEPFRFEIDGVKVCVLAFAEHEFNCAVDYKIGAALWDDFDSIKLIKKIKEECDFLIVQYHGGIEHYRIPSPLLQKKCRAMAEAGADFVTCQHSHCVGTKEIWQGSEILYGQGNSIFGYEEDRPMWNTGLVVKISFQDGKASINYIPKEARSDGHYLMEDKKAAEFLADFNDLSSQITNQEFVKDSWIKFCEKQKDGYLPMVYARGRLFNKLNRITEGKIVSMLTKRIARRNAMNLIRCDAHREVVTTIHETDYYK